MKYFIAVFVMCALAPLAFGTSASHWNHTTEADFKKGKFNNTVATNLGDVKLSRAVKTMLEQDAKITAVYSLVEAADGTIYAGTGPQGIVLSLKGEKVSTIATLEDANVFSLLIGADGKLLIGTGGEKGRILRVEKAGEKPAEIFSAEGVQYVWKMVQTPDGNIYAATGPNGQLFEIRPDGSRSELFDSDENNLLSMVTDGKDFLFVGTDPNGLVYRINRKTRDVFVLYDAAESEISALALDKDGNLYAGTGQASDADEAGAAEAAETEKSGRPEGGAEVTPLPSPKPRDPKPPELPKPNPGEPDPIPKSRTNLFMGDPALEKVLGREANPQAPGDPNPTPAPPAPPKNRQQAAAAAAMARPQLPNVPLPIPTPTEGNAIYRIDPAGFVTEVFREPVMILSIFEKDGTLLVGTGSEGLVYQVSPAAEETQVLAKVNPKQVMSMLATKDGRVMLGLANVGGLAIMSSGFATEGNYISPVLDAGQISRFGKLQLRGSLPGGTSLTVATRSGNLQEPGERGWSKWSEESPATEFLQVSSPSARFVQYRLSFTSKEGKSTAVVDEVDLAYQLPNVAPQVKSVKIASAPDENSPPSARALAAIGPAALAAAAAGMKDTTPPGRQRIITWESTDANNDPLEYVLYFRSGTRGPWILMQDKLKEATYTWDTRGVPDGRYQVRVVASDAKANARGEGKIGSRISDPLTVDNTPPVIGDMKATVQGKSAHIEAKIIDRTSIVAKVEYALDSKDEWQAVNASDTIFDSPEEAVNFTIDGLAAGVHQIMLRASDAHNNPAYETVTVTIESK